MTKNDPGERQIIGFSDIGRRYHQGLTISPLDDNSLPAGTQITDLGANTNYIELAPEMIGDECQIC